MTSFARDAFAVFLGGGAGACLRLAITAGFPTAALSSLDTWVPGLAAFPLSTFIINCAGAFALGLLVAFLALLGPDAGWLRSVRLAVGAGALGGFTTYSAFAVQTAQLVLADRWLVALSYVLLSLGAGFGLSAAGLRAGKTLGAGARTAGGGR